MNRTKKVWFNTLTAVLHMVINQLISLTVSIKVLEVYGADYHGLNSVLSNIMTWILMIEGGLTTASTVAMYKPYMSKDYDRCNRILSASRIKYYQIGGVIFLVGVAVAALYPFIVKTPVPYWDIFLMFFIMTCSTSFGVFFTRKYAIMYTVTQNEFINQLVTILISILGNAVIYFMACKAANYLWIRTIYLIVTVVTGLTLCLIIKRKYRFLNYRAEPEMDAIKGTRDVVVQKLTSVIRTSVPSLYISTAIGTTAASIYSVNLYGYNFIRTVVTNVLTATQSGIGQIVAERDSAEVYKVYRVFEYISTTVLLWLMTTAVMVTIPFINYYTRNVPDIEYINYFLWLIIPINVTIQLLHIPSGVIINMNARFKEDRNFQIISIAVMLAVMFVGGKLAGLEGIMVGVFAGSVTLAVQEVWFTRRHIFRMGYLEFFRPILIDLGVLVPVMFLEYRIVPQKVGIAQFFLWGFIIAAIHGALIAGVNFLLERERMLLGLERVKRMLKIGKKK